MEIGTADWSLLLTGSHHKRQDRQVRNLLTLASMLDWTLPQKATVLSQFGFFFEFWKFRIGSLSLVIEHVSDLHMVDLFTMQGSREALVVVIREDIHHTLSDTWTLQHYTDSRIITWLHEMIPESSHWLQDSIVSIYTLWAPSHFYTIKMPRCGGAGRIADLTVYRLKLRVWMQMCMHVWKDTRVRVFT